jgi:hypothetical protein
VGARLQPLACSSSHSISSSSASVPFACTHMALSPLSPAAGRPQEGDQPPV